MSEQVNLQEFLDGFIAESEQIVATSTAALLELEQANAEGTLRPRVVRDLFRALHTQKGLAAMMSIRPIVDLAHALETVLRTADQNGGRLGPRAVELGLICVRTIAERVRAVSEGRSITAAPDNLLDELARVDVSGASPAAAPFVAASWDKRLSPGERTQLASALQAGHAAYTLTFAPSEETAARGMSIATVRQAVTELGELVKVVPRSQPPSGDAPAGLVFEMLVLSDATVEALADAVGTAPANVERVVGEHVEPVQLAEPPPDDPPVSTVRAVVRVELERLDDLQDQLSGLIVSRYRLEREIVAFAERGHDVRGLRDVAEGQARQLRDLRRAILRVRMVRVSEAVEPLLLVARSLSKPGIKELKLELDVGAAELDKAVADRLLPALIHLVRNAADHGIESIVDRERAGKPRAGLIRIVCRELSGNHLELTVGDDGRGLDRAAIAKRARRELSSTEDLLDAIATPGFSTRDTVSETSGRGFGMDIVRRVVETELGGALRLRSSPGAGTSFTLQIPLTISIIDVFSLHCAAQTFVVPVATVDEILDLEGLPHVVGPSTSTRLPVAMVERHGRPLPVVSLATLLRMPRASGTPAQGLVLRRQGEPVAFGVDRVIGRHEVVVRPIEDVLVRAPGVAGATDLGDGRPTLLLDLVELGARLAGWSKEAAS